MKEFVEKLIGRLEEYQNQLDTDMWARECDNWYGQLCNGKSEGVDEIIEIVNQLAEEYNNGWIPCSERLPNKEEYLKDGGRFIVTDGNRRYQSIWDIYNHCFRTVKLFDIGKSRFEVDNCVIAWQPLPAFYQKGE